MKKWLLILILFQSIHIWSQNEGDTHSREGNLEEAINAFKASLKIKNDALIVGLVNELSKELIDQEHSK